jgi:lysophospholipase L1-like esterase
MMLFEKNDKLIMIGDSITDCGRSKPDGEGLFDPYGNGYVNMVKAFLDSSYPDLAIRVINKGNSGNTVRDLKKRWDDDVLALQPEWLSILIGINDVWRHFDTPKMVENHVGLEEYEDTLEELINKTRPNLKGLVLMTPYFIESNSADPMRIKMVEFAGVVRKLASKYDAVLVDTQQGFDGMLSEMHPMALAWDRIHPNTSGHALLASCFLKAVGFEL